MKRIAFLLGTALLASVSFAAAHEQQDEHEHDDRAQFKDEEGRYYQQLGPYVRPEDAPMPGVDESARPEYIVNRNQGVRRHDGLYVRMAFGLGGASDALNSPQHQSVGQSSLTSGDDLVASSGFATVSEFALGYGIWRGLVGGVGLFNTTMPDMQGDLRGRRTRQVDFNTSQFSVLAPLVDYYFDERGGFHVQGALGVAIYVAGAGRTQSEDFFAQAHTALGLGWMLGAGYEWWVGEQWGFGLLGRYCHGSGSGSDAEGFDWEHSGGVPSGLLTLTYQ